MILIWMNSWHSKPTFNCPMMIIMREKLSEIVLTAHHIMGIHGRIEAIKLVKFR